MPNENLCYFVNCKGLSKSCNFFEEKNPTFKNNKDYFNCMLTEMFDGMSIYVKSALLGFFVDKILLKITKKFVLVSGDSHLCVPKEVLNYNEIVSKGRTDANNFVKIISKIQMDVPLN